MNKPIAVVVGLCAHGLTLTRALTRAKLPVVAIEANPTLPGVRTNSADVRIVQDINGPGLIKALKQLAPNLSKSATGVPILFLTNDTMIATVAENYADLHGLYNLSWADSRAGVVSLLRKAGIEQRCKDTELPYPKSLVVHSTHSIKAQLSALSFPVIFKPDRPISSYKTLVVDDIDQLETALPTLEAALPAVAQEFIPGDDSTLYFAALYLDSGDVVARFEGRKLRSRPMGHTTIAISEPNDQTYRLALQFFFGLRLSGPVSLEFKRDPSGTFWVIEPTVGRTDFWVGLCIQGGVNFPLIEYRRVLDERWINRNEGKDALWINEQRDPLAMIWLLFRHPRLLSARVVYVFADTRDLRPFLVWISELLLSLPERGVKKVKKLLFPNFGT